MVTHANGRKEPIHVGATGPRMLKLSGALAYGVILMNGVAPDLIKAAIDIVHHGSPPSPHAASLSLARFTNSRSGGCYSTIDPCGVRLGRQRVAHLL